MRKIVLSAVFLCAAQLAVAQQVQLLEDQSSQDQKKTASDQSDMPQIIVPSEEKPAEAKPAEETPAAAVPPLPAPAPEKPKPAVKGKGKSKKTFKGGLPASTATVKTEGAAPAAVPAKPEAAAVAVSSPAARPAPAAPAAAPAPVAQPAPVPAASAAGDLPSLDSISAAPAKPAEAVKPAAPPATKPAEAAKPAVPPAPKPAEAVKPVPAPARTTAVKPAAPAKPAMVQAAPAAEKKEVPGGGFEVGKTHTVIGGDTLWGLSGKYYHDPYKWGKIYNANLKTVSNPDRIYPKSELIIPEVTEEVKPVLRKAAPAERAPAISAAEAAPAPVSGPETSEAVQPVPGEYAAGAPAEAAAFRTKPSAPLLKDEESVVRSELSEDMPEHQKEWAAGVRVVPENWREDGAVAGREKGEDDSEADSLSLSGDIINVSMDPACSVKTGDYLAVFMKGAYAYSKAGKRIGREIQPVGMLEVLTSDGHSVKARVADATTPIVKGYVVKKK